MGELTIGGATFVADGDAAKDAQKYLSQFQEFDWMTKSGQQWYKIDEVSNGLALGEEALRRACVNGEFPGAQNYGPGIGWRIPRSSLILWIYEQRRKAKS